MIIESSRVQVHLGGTANGGTVTLNRRFVPTSSTKAKTFFLFLFAFLAVKFAVLPKVAPPGKVVPSWKWRPAMDLG